MVERSGDTQFFAGAFLMPLLMTYNLPVENKLPDICNDASKLIILILALRLT